MNGLTTLLIAVFFFAMGAAIVGLIWYLKGMSKRLQGKETPAASEDKDLVEMARLMRHLQTQELVVQVDGKSYTAPHELTPAQHRRLILTSDVLVQWLEKPGPPPEAEIAPAAEPEPGVPTPETVEDLPAAFSDATPPITAEAEQGVKPVSTELPDLVSGMRSKPAVPPPVFKSIAMQINEILQAKITGTPLESRGITLTDAPDRGVLVTLDGKQYNGVMEVPDEEVRNAIRAAVKEWDTKK